MGHKTAFFVKFHCALVETPHVESYIVTSASLSKIHHIIIQALADMPAPDILVHTKVVYVKGLYICQYVIIYMLLKTNVFTRMRVWPPMVKKERKSAE